MRKIQILILLILTASIIFAQNNANKDILKETNTSFLKQKAKEFKRIAEKKKAIAKLKAKDNSWKEIIKTKNSFLELQSISESGKPIYYTTCNADAAISLSTNELYSGGALGLSLDGTNMLAGEWDGGGVLASHQEFNNTGTSRINQMDSPSSTHYHSTHVAGTIIAGGVQAQAKGMAYNASINAYDWNDDDAEMATEAVNGLLISNHSYGFVTGWWWNGSSWQWAGDEGISNQEDWKFGFYGTAAQAWDLISYNAPYYLIVKSAGNDRGDGPAGGAYPQDGPYDCIPIKGNAKNILTVGAVQDVAGGYQGDPNDVVMSGFSSWGPSDDGRIKPDICGNGVGLYSALDGNNSDYGSLSGTSMSAPNVTGSLLLLQQHYFNLNASYMKSATLKALVIHTADECGPDAGPDYMFGWGLLNAETAAQLISDRNISALINEENYTGVDYDLNISATGTEPLAVTIVWTDPAGTPPAAGLDPPDPMLVNDLDMRLIGNSNTYFPYMLDKDNPSAAATTGDNDVDNVEKIYLANPVAGEYTIHITHEGTLNGGSQNYSLIVSGITNGPIVITNDPTNIGDNSVEASGEVVSENGQTVSERGFVYSTLPSPTVNDSKVISGSGIGEFTSNISGLNSSTTYYLKAYAINSNGTSYGQEKVFTTSCGSAMSLPFAEDFESADFPPACWTSYRGTNGLGTVYDWMAVTDPQQGVKAAFVRYEDVTGGLAEDWLVSPLISINALSTLSFYQKQSYDLEFNSNYSIRISTTSQTDPNSFITQEFWDESDFGTSYTEQTINLGAYTGQDIYIAFVMENDDGDDWFIDNISITNNLVVPSASILATPGCSTGTITISSDQSGIQTFYLTQNDGTVISSVTEDATSHDFLGITDGIYRGKVEKDGQMSGLSSAANLVNMDVPEQPSTISGDLNPCEGSTQIYTVTNDANVDSYSWSLPATWTGSSTSNNITVVVGQFEGYLSVIPANSCGAGTEQSVIVVPSFIPDQPSAISGNTQVCEGTTEVYTVNNDSFVDTYTWALPSGWTGSSSTNTISVTIGSNDGNISVTPSNECGIGTAQSLAVEVSNIGPNQPDDIIGDFTSCNGATETYSVPNDPAVTTYAWNLPAGWTGNSTTNSITVSVGSSSGEISVIPTNLCGSGPAQTAFIDVSGSVPSQPDPITGSVLVCEGASENYSVNLEAGLEYTWLLPSGWSGASLTNEITVTVGNTSGDIIVFPANGCGVGPSQNLFVEVNNIPFQPDAITGDESPCEASTQTYSVTLDDGATYSWLLPEDWTGTSTTNSITVTVGTLDGNISVTASNMCGESPAEVLTVMSTHVLGDPGEISGATEVCAGDENVAYSISEMEDADSYTWTLPDNAEIVSGLGTASILVDFFNNAETGYVTVHTQNSCGLSSTSVLGVGIGYIPSIPNDIMGLNAVMETQTETYEIDEVGWADSYQWTLDPSWILNSGSGTPVVSISFPMGASSGVLGVRAENFCGSSDMRTMNIEILPIAVSSVETEQSIKLYPNPSNGLVFIEMPYTLIEPVIIKVTALSGALILEDKIDKGFDKTSLDLSELPPGNYMIDIENSKVKEHFKILINR